MTTVIGASKKSQQICTRMITIPHPIQIRFSYTYEEFRDLVAELARNKSTTGAMDPSRIAATELNAQRIKRLDKQTVLMPELVTLAENFKRRCDWILIVESWCGDGAQCVPVIAKIVEKIPHVHLKLILRDEHPEVMDRYLTNGNRAIPKLICIDRDSHRELGVWGPRPSGIQQMVINYKQQHPGVSHDEFVKQLHLWYAKDKTVSLQEDFIHLLKEWNTGA